MSCLDMTESQCTCFCSVNLEQILFQHFQKIVKSINHSNPVESSLHPKDGKYDLLLHPQVLGIQI